MIERFAACAALLVASAAPGLADTITIGWTPVEHPELAGYRVDVRSADGTLEQSHEIPASQVELTLDLLGGGCATHCVSMRSVGLDGEAGDPTPNLCGLSDPEVFDVAVKPEGLWIKGDNFSPSVQVFLDGETNPVPVTRVDCGVLLVPSVLHESVLARNPEDAVSVLWTLPFPGYLDGPPPGRSVVFECAGGSTVTAVSHTPGLGLAIEADAPGLGTSCALAIGQVLALPGAAPSKLKQLPLGADSSIYVFTD